MSHWRLKFFSTALLYFLDMLKDKRIPRLKLR
jgi:hypothetical protein